MHGFSNEFRNEREMLYLTITRAEADKCDIIEKENWKGLEESRENGCCLHITFFKKIF